MSPDIPAVEMHIVEMTNAYRAKHKLAPVEHNPQLALAARAFAKYLARNDKFSHTADGRGPAERAKKSGYDYCQIAENLALNQDSRGFTPEGLAASAVEGWINSPGHRKNLKARHVTDIGVAVATSADRIPKFISVQLFGRPSSKLYSFQISNSSGLSVSYSFGGETHSVAPDMAVKHSSCMPGTLAFTRAGSWFSGTALNEKHKAANGKVFHLSKDKAKGVRVSVGVSEKVGGR